ncbi:MAG: prepilin-type N-terminal cleavage/methylation domain-containing protein [Candidatus Omnitrophica bacterium]|nr:prepilin-type N-terminal cleavage/methylation domain-containing protein [Candidatus Omnitrophota bacterium]
MKKNHGFTLAELLIATTVLLLASVGILFTYVQCLDLNSINHDSSSVMQQTRNMMEEILASSSATVHDTYNEKTFPIERPTGIILVKVNDQDPQLLIVTVKSFWKQAKGRVIGEDLNLNGSLEENEDTNKNGELDSPYTLVSYIYHR